MPFTSNTAAVLSNARRSPDSLASWNLAATRSGSPSAILMELIMSEKYELENGLELLCYCTQGWYSLS